MENEREADIVGEWHKRDEQSRRYGPQAHYNRVWCRPDVEAADRPTIVDATMRDTKGDAKGLLPREDLAS